ncbi:uncharacterized protein LOC142330058 isoform X2 [Lycorma delicatula]|uniref:uncharacterized protein LOC142330058 isoform X2 n=1 Tax=Lycorma delicatula TaxID=130591 RepID=UPI003F515D17
MKSLYPLIIYILISELEHDLKLIKIKSFCLEIVVHNNQSSVLINNTNNWNNHTELQKLLNFLNSVTINDNVIELNNDKNIYNKTEDLKYLPKSINVNDTRNNTHENLQKPHNLFFTNKPNENLHIKFKIERDYSIQNSSNNNNEIYRTYLNITTLFHNDEQNVNKGRIDGNYNNMLLPDDVDQLRKAKTEKILHNDENLINMKSNENKFSNLNVTSSNKESDLNKIKKYTNITVELENLLSKNFNSSSFDINNLGNDRLKDTSNNVELQNHRFRREVDWLTRNIQ